MNKRRKQRINDLLIVTVSGATLSMINTLILRKSLIKKIRDKE